MSIESALKARRTYYSINDKLPVEKSAVEERIQQLTELVPDAFNMKSSRVVVTFDDYHRKLWDTIYDVFGGKVPREKIDSFRAGAGTILYYYDIATVEGLQEKFPRYAENFPGWALQASGMLQISVWSGLRELGIGASLQHYNPVIDEAMRGLFGVPETWRLIAEMPFGGIVEEPGPKPAEDIKARVKIFR